MVNDFNLTEFLKHFASKEFPVQLIFYIFGVTNFFTVGYIAHGYLYGFKELTLSQLFIIFMMSCYISMISLFIFLPVSRLVVMSIEVLNGIISSIIKRDKKQYKKWDIEDYAKFAYFSLSLNNAVIIFVMSGLILFFDSLNSQIQTKIVTFLFMYIPIATAIVGALVINVEISYLSKENIKKQKKPVEKNPSNTE